MYPATELVKAIINRQAHAHGHRPLRQVKTTEQIMEGLLRGVDYWVETPDAIPGVRGPRSFTIEEEARIVARGGEFTPSLLRATVPERELALGYMVEYLSPAQGGDYMVFEVPTSRSRESLIELTRSLGLRTIMGEQGRVTVFDGPWARRSHIVGVRPAGRKKVRCLRLATREAMYLTGGFVPTHNSVLINGFIYPESTDGSGVAVGV